MKTFKIFVAIMAIAIAASCSTSYNASRVSIPLKNISDTNKELVAFAYGTSHDLMTAKMIAENECRGNLSQKIQSNVRSAIETYRSQGGASTADSGIVNSYEQITEIDTRSIATVCLGGVSDIEHVILKDATTGEFVYWVAMSIKKEDVAKAISAKNPKELTSSDRKTIENRRNKFTELVDRQ